MFYFQVYSWKVGQRFMPGARHNTSGKAGGLKDVNRSKRLKSLWATLKVATF
jgi:hypothetical protein